ncbi:MAG TPA: AraC family transcriptional regulator [Xanthomonadaceae bacterium]|nr:AraC family transcriptional regulator [Xanthomonadaceae bacterium]
MDPNLPALEMQTLFDALPDVVFFVKDRQGCYTHCNLTLVRRLGRKQRSEVIGKSPLEVFPLPLGGSYMMQDRRVLCGELIDNQLEVHLYPNRLPGWCLTFKRPLCEGDDVSGVIGISRDLDPQQGHDTQYEKLRLALAYLHANYAQNVRMRTLVDLTGFSMSKLQRSFRRVFQLTPQQVLAKLRLQMAMHLLHGAQSVTEIGHACGFSDQSAFTRQFKSATGMTPREYRLLANAHLVEPAAPP